MAANRLKRPPLPWRRWIVLCSCLAAATAAANGLALEKRALFGGAVEILLPASFDIMPEEMIELKYPSGNRPALVYSNESGTVNLAFSYTPNPLTQDGLPELKEQMIRVFKALYPSADWRSEGMELVNGRKVAYLELVTPAADTRIYNLLFFTDVGGRALLCTFNCPEEQSGDWEAAALRILLSLTVRESR